MTQLPPNKINRRTALKLLSSGAAGVVLPSAVAFAGHSAAGAGGPSVSAFTTEALSSQLSRKPLKIEIITGKSAPEDTVLLSSSGDHPLILRQFRPALLAIGDRTIDLNQFLSSAAPAPGITPVLALDAGATQSVLLPVKQRPADPAMREYLSVDAAVETIGEGTESITLNALVDADGLAVVYLPQAEDAIKFA